MKQIPYRFSGSRGLYQQEEIKVLVAFIRAVTDFDNSRDLFFLALSDVYKADPYELARIAGHASKKNLTLHAVFKAVAEGRGPVDLPPETEATIKRIFADILGFVDMAATQSAGAVVYAFLEKSGYLKSLLEPMSLESEIRVKNIRLFFDKIKGFTDLAENDSLRSFARYLDILAEVGDNPATSEADLDEDAVSVLTVHKAKGLEFGTVFLVGLIEDRFPGRERRERIPVPDAVLKESLPGRENYLQEERRLFYVGMTRARRALYLTWARDYGLKRSKKVSPFVLEALDISMMPDEVLRATVLEEIRRYALSDGRPKAPAAVRPPGRPEAELRPGRGLPHLPAQVQVPPRHARARPAAPLPRLRPRPPRRDQLLPPAADEGEAAGREVSSSTPTPRAGSTRATSAASTRRCARRPASGPCGSSTAGGGFERVAGLPRESLPLAGGRPSLLGALRPGRFPTPTARSSSTTRRPRSTRRKRPTGAAAASLQLDVYALSFLKTEGMMPVETPAPFPGVRPRRPGGERGEGAAAGGGEDPGDGRRPPGRRSRRPARLAHLLRLRIQDDLSLVLRVLNDLQELNLWLQGGSSLGRRGAEAAEEGAEGCRRSEHRAVIQPASGRRRPSRLRTGTA